MKKLFVISLSALLLSGCAYGVLSKEAPPRAMTTSPQAPMCVIMCFVHNTQSDTQEDIKSEGGGAITNSTTETTEDASKDSPIGGLADVSSKPAQGPAPQ